MKQALFAIALAILALVWFAERRAASRLAREIDRLHRQNAALPELLEERARLSRRLAVAGIGDRQSDQPAVETFSEPAGESLPGKPLPIGSWVEVRNCGFRGQATPGASVESALWAAAGGDVAALRQLLAVPEETHAAAAALWTSLPVATRSAFQGPDDLVAALSIRRIPLGEAQLVWLDQTGPDNATACLFLKDPVNPIGANALATVPDGPGLAPPQLAPDANSVTAYLALQRDAGAWRLVVPPAAIAAMAQDLMVAANPKG